MKIQFIVLALLIIHIQSNSQIKPLSVECSDSVLMAIKGKYAQSGNIISPGTSTVLSTAQQKDVFRRMDMIHQMLLETYPEPTGLEGRWWKTLGHGLFAHDMNYTKGISVCTYAYYIAFSSYMCVQNRSKDLFCCEPNGALLNVFANNLGHFRNNMRMDSSMTINGLPFFMRNPVKGTWKGYELLQCSGNSRAVLLHRKDELPYIPVTRKQYLEFSLAYLNDFYDESIKLTKAMPVRTLEVQEALRTKSLDKIDTDYRNNPKNRDIIRKNFQDTYKTDQERRDESVNKIIENKIAVIKRYDNELEKTKAEGLLDSPAIVAGIAPVTEDEPIFVPEGENGKMLVTENPSYIRKDLPKSVPQFILLYWSWSDHLPQYGGTAGRYFRKMLEEKFPIEKLQAMIDK